ncbi:MAG: type II secretion system protein [Phycisphaerales bacterium]|nr:type II secretion system protein [Phycisphaerales bacterium]
MRRGFTLIELLAVIAIITVLIGILIPTLGGARESARRTQCLANLAQIGIGTQLYMDAESKGVLPVVRPFHEGEPGGGSDPSLLDVLSQYLDTPVPTRDTPEEDFVLGRNSCYRCPSDLGGSGDNGRPLWASAGTSYEYFPGLLMTATEIVFAAESPRIEQVVTRALELQAESGKPAPLLNCNDDWHTLRSGGPSRNAVYFPGMRADWLEELSSDEAEDLFGLIGRLLGV